MLAMCDMCGSKNCHTRHLLGAVEYYCTDCRHVEIDVETYDEFDIEELQEPKAPSSSG